jgi:transposase
MDIATVGLDLAKSVLQVHAVDLQGHTVVSKQLRRTDVLRYFATLKPCALVYGGSDVLVNVFASSVVLAVFFLCTGRRERRGHS